MEFNDIGNDFPHGAAVLDRCYRLMTCQYDECKLTSMKVKLQPTVNIPNNWSLKLGSIIDRNYSGPENTAALGNMTDEDDVHAKAIFSNPGAVIQMFNSNRIYPMSRPCYPNDMKEKMSFIDSTIGYNSTVGSSPLSNVWNLAWAASDTDFAPCFFYALQSSIAPSANAFITFSYSVDYTFVFRNPKNSLDRFLTLEARGYVNPSAKKVEDEPERSKFIPVSELTTDEEEVSKASK